MSLDKIALIGIILVGGSAAIGYAVLLVIGVVATFPFGLPALLVAGLFVFVCWRVLQDRLNNKEDDYYEKNVDK